MHPNVIDDAESITELLVQTKRIAVLGIKPESRADAAAHYVPKYLVDMGFDVVPVPVYYPEVTTILGRRVYRSVADVPKPVDLVDVFRRSQDLMPHLADLLAQAGIKVVQDRCLMVELRVREALRRRSSS